MHEPVVYYGRHAIDESDIESVAAVLRNGNLTQGDQVPAFEQALCDYTKSRYCTVTTNATSALHIALVTLGVGPDDRVWTSPISFVASANCARYCGAKIDFVDIDPLTRNLSVEHLANKLKKAETQQQLPKVLIAVHLSGLPGHLAEISTLCQQYDVRLIEDASHALGARYKDSPIGNCQWSEMTIFSFHPVKMITTGEGGAITTNKAEYKQQLDHLRSHGITRDPHRLNNTDQPSFYYEQQTLGFNYRMTDIQAALGLSQLTKLETFIQTREKWVRYYEEKFEKGTVQLPTIPTHGRSSWHLYIINLSHHDDTAENETSRNRLFEALKAQNILCNLHYWPIHLQPYYRQFGFQPGDYPNAETYARTALTLPLHNGLTEDICDKIAMTVMEHLN